NAPLRVAADELVDAQRGQYAGQPLGLADPRGTEWTDGVLAVPALPLDRLGMTQQDQCGGDGDDTAQAVQDVHVTRVAELAPCLVHRKPGDLVDLVVRLELAGVDRCGGPVVHELVSGPTVLADRVALHAERWTEYDVLSGLLLDLPPCTE